MASRAGASASDAIFVAVRVRPFSLGERRGDGRSMVSVVDDKMICFDPPSNGGAATAAEGRRMGVRVARNRRYAYDHVFDADAGQEAVFRVTTRPLIDEVVKGLNATVLAYGATGSGKTHTMVGSTAGGAGVMVLAIESLFECMRKATDARFALELSYLEVYNETIRDLLDESGAESAQTGGLALRQDARNGATVCGLTWHAPDAASDVLEMLERGNARRAVGATGANAASSRSHAVLQIRLRRSARAAGVEEEQRRSTLTLIDLAGSERASVTQNRGGTLNEGANINRSLLALANCINALAKGGAGAHVPYRDSKLTRLLRDALGGNCRTAIIATVSPAALSAEDTHNTLKYAHRAKEIKVKATANKVSVKHHVSKYRDIIAGLQGEVASWKAKFEKVQARLAAAEAGAKREKADAEDADEGARAAELYAEIDASFSRRATAEEQLAQLRSEGAAAGEDAAAGQKRRELEAEIEAQLEAAEAEEGVLHASLRKLKSTEKRALLQQEIRCRTLQLELADAHRQLAARPPAAAAAPVAAAPVVAAPAAAPLPAGRIAAPVASPRAGCCRAGGRRRLAGADAAGARRRRRGGPPAERRQPGRHRSRRRLADSAGAPEEVVDWRRRLGV